MPNLTKHTAWELAWLICFTCASIVLTAPDQKGVFNLSVLITGMLCVLLAAKGNYFSYVFGTYNTIAYAWLAYTNGLYGEMGLNLFFFLPMNVVGFMMWRRHTTRLVVDMRGLNMAAFLGVIVLCLAATAAMGWLLSLIEGQKTPYIDASTNVLSVVATVLMVWRYREQWILYIILNVFSILMWALRAADGSEDGIMMMLMWFAYLSNAVYGCLVWYKGAAKTCKPE